MCVSHGIRTKSAYTATLYSHSDRRTSIATCLPARSQHSCKCSAHCTSSYRTHTHTHIQFARTQTQAITSHPFTARRPNGARAFCVRWATRCALHAARFDRLHTYVLTCTRVRNPSPRFGCRPIGMYIFCVCVFFRFFFPFRRCSPEMCARIIPYNMLAPAGCGLCTHTHTHRNMRRGHATRRRTWRTNVHMYWNGMYDSHVYVLMRLHVSNVVLVMIHIEARIYNYTMCRQMCVGMHDRRWCSSCPGVIVVILHHTNIDLVIYKTHTFPLASAF